jgi:hypothetical protein
VSFPYTSFSAYQIHLLSRTNAQNDALLHKLIHTKLLSGSLNQDLKLPPAKKRKALEGRILELTADAKLGKGERQVRDSERNKAAKRVREGIARKQKERQKQELEEVSFTLFHLRNYPVEKHKQAKNLGNYHPSLKRVFEASATSKPRKREKGLRMGVGKFSQGSLRLSRDDINRVMDEGHRVSPEDTGELSIGLGKQIPSALLTDVQWLLSGTRIVAIFHHVLINFSICFVLRISYEDKHQTYLSYFRRSGSPAGQS